MKNKKLYFINRGTQLLFVKKGAHVFLYLINKIQFLKMYYFLPIKQLYTLNKQLNCIIQFYTINSNLAGNTNIIQKFIFNSQNLKNLKWLFSGKGFKIKKLLKGTFFNFNNSHIKMIMLKKLKFLKLQKNVFVILSKQAFFKMQFLIFFSKLFKLNIFTKRGIRLSSAVILQKKIKKK